MNAVGQWLCHEMAVSAAMWFSVLFSVTRGSVKQLKHPSPPVLITTIITSGDTMAPVSTQPIPSLMNVYTVSSFGDEKHPQQCQVHYDSEQPCGCADSSSHRACHKARLRKMLLPVALSLLAVGAMLVISCATDINLLDLIGLGGDSGSVLGKRQTSSSSSFTNNKRG
jgi:hypothetical protein